MLLDLQEIQEPRATLVLLALWELQEYKEQQGAQVLLELLASKVLLAVAVEVLQVRYSQTNLPYL